MAVGKWGESFLKTGLPLEHLTAMTLRSMNYGCSTHFEYKRKNRENEEKWFEIDIVSSSPFANKDTSLTYIIECKYNDTSRFWFFLPHKLDYKANNDRALNIGPVQTLQKPKMNSILKMFPISSWGTVVSEDGVKQENAVYTAIQQLSNSFVPFSMFLNYSINLDSEIIGKNPFELIPKTDAIIPVVVTNARIFRLKSNIIDLDTIRKANSPIDIADELDCTWYFNEINMETLASNGEKISELQKEYAEFVYRWPFLSKTMEAYDDRPNWILVCNIKKLLKVLKKIENHFKKLQMIPSSEALKKEAKKK